MQVGALDGEGDVAALLDAGELVRRRRSQGGVEGDVGRLLGGRAGGYIAAPLAVGARSRAPAGGPSSQAVQLAFQAARAKDLSGLNAVAAFPPIGLKRIGGLLQGRLGFTQPALFLARLAGYAVRLTLFFCSDSTSSGPVSATPASPTWD